jgi:putative transposase
MDYIHYNPVKHGLSQTPTGWEYSTIHRLIKQGVYPANWALMPADGPDKEHDYGESR